jgi:hypothetical protein
MNFQVKILAAIGLSVLFISTAVFATDFYWEIAADEGSTVFTYGGAFDNKEEFKISPGRNIFGPFFPDDRTWCKWIGDRKLWVDYRIDPSFQPSDFDGIDMPGIPIPAFDGIDMPGQVIAVVDVLMWTEAVTQGDIFREDTDFAFGIVITHGITYKDASGIAFENLAKEVLEDSDFINNLPTYAGDAEEVVEGRDTLYFAEPTSVKSLGKLATTWATIKQNR